MKKLIFKDGTEVLFTDESTITNCVTILNSFAEVDVIRNEFTVENLVGATFAGEPVTDIIPVSASANAAVGGNVTVTFTNRAKTREEILEEQVNELQVAIMELASGNAAQEG